jgi:hypothetical protein
MKTPQIIHRLLCLDIVFMKRCAFFADYFNGKEIREVASRGSQIIQNTAQL